MHEERERGGIATNCELTLVRKNGEHFPGEVSSVILPGEEPHAFVIVRDITERKRSAELLENAVLENQRRAAEVEAILQGIPYALYFRRRRRFARVKSGSGRWRTIRRS